MRWRETELALREQLQPAFFLLPLNFCCSLQGLKVYESHARLISSWSVPLAEDVQVGVRTLHWECLHCNFANTLFLCSNAVSN